MLISFRSDENGTSPTRGKRSSSTSGARAGLAGGDQQRAFGRIALHRPSAVALLHGGVVGAIGDGERAFEFDSQRAVDGAAVLALNRARRARTRSLRT